MKLLHIEVWCKPHYFEWKLSLPRIKKINRVRETEPDRSIAFREPKWFKNSKKHISGPLQHKKNPSYVIFGTTRSDMCKTLNLLQLETSWSRDIHRVFKCFSIELVFEPKIDTAAKKVMALLANTIQLQHVQNLADFYEITGTIMGFRKILY